MAGVENPQFHRTCPFDTFVYGKRRDLTIIKWWTQRSVLFQLWVSTSWWKGWFQSRISNNAGRTVFDEARLRLRDTGVGRSPGSVWKCWCLTNEGEATNLCLTCLFSIMHVLRPNREGAYTPFRDQSLFVDNAIDRSMRFLFAFKAHYPCDRIKLIHVERVPETAGLWGPVTFPND